MPKHAPTRIRVYLAISFLLSLFLFHMGVQHNPQWQFIDLSSNELDLGYATLFFVQNIAVLLALPLIVELVLLMGAKLHRQQARRDHDRQWLRWALIESVGAATMIGAVAAYTAWHHGEGAPEGIEVLIWACGSLFLRSAVFFFVVILVAEIAVRLAVSFGQRLLER